MTTTIRIPASPTSAPAPAATSSPGTTGLGAVHVRWDDYSGSAAADDSIALLSSRSMYEIAGLDRGRWTIVAVDASLADTADQVVIFAVDRTVEPDPLASASLGVTAFHLDPSTRVDEFLHEAFQRVSFRLISTLATDRELRVDGHQALPRTL